MRPALHQTRDRVVRRLLSSVVVAACQLAIAFGAAPAQADDSAIKADGSRLKNEIRAAFIYNIARFINWPEAAVFPNAEQINFCLYRSNPLGAAIATIAGKPLHQRSLQFNQIASLTDAAPCHAVLIPSAELKAYQREAAASPPLGALTIVDLSDGNHRHKAHRGVMVTLVRKGANLGFEINLETMRDGGFRASSELLKLAIILVEDAR